MLLLSFTTTATAELVISMTWCYHRTTQETARAGSSGSCLVFHAIHRHECTVMLISDDQNLLLIAKWSLLVDTRRSACMYQCQHLACSNTQMDRCSHVETLLHTCTYWVCICQLLEGHNVLTRQYALQYPWSRIHARLSWASQTSLPEYMQLALNHFESALPQIRSQVCVVFMQYL